MSSNGSIVPSNFLYSLYSIGYLYNCYFGDNFGLGCFALLSYSQTPYFYWL
ncbi:unnamed protein product [Meloidogyne enterolobii]|uniref:Uncharacterized protein n=1 Tax=Meloidogyne enterolobii TaxID=390850 RepID=A0ACB1B6K8_MELEN